MVLHPVDYRYGVDDLEKFLSPEGFLRFKLEVEGAYSLAMEEMGICPEGVGREIYERSRDGSVTYKEVKEREKKTRHDIRAMVQALADKVSEEARPYVHLGLTSYDVVDTANAARIGDVNREVILPDLEDLYTSLMEIAERGKDRIQIGRTHGQHAEPTTFGKEMAVYVHRFREGCKRIEESADNLRGKISGAVGTRAQLGLLTDRPEELERRTLAKLGLEPAEITTQIVPYEAMANYFAQLMITFGTLDDLANDMRQLQRTEIGEVREKFEKGQVGSSTMPHKRNPVSWENICTK